MASIISASTTSGTALNMSADTTGVLQLATGATPTTAVTIDTSQNVGIGTTSPSSGTNPGTLAVQTGQNFGMSIYRTSTNPAQIAFLDNNNSCALGTDGNNSMVFYNNSRTTERMRIDTSGNVGIGTTSLTGLTTGSLVSAGSLLTKGPLSAHQTSAGVFEFNSGDNSTNIRSYGATSGTGRITFNTGGGGGTADTERMRIDSSGGLILAGSTAQKATGTTWSNPSDQRLKDNIRDYTKGTTELMQVRVREWEYNGKGNTTEGMKGLGVVADEVMTVLPDTVETYDAKLNADDEETTAIKKFDATEITWLLVKTVQEQQTIINDLKARIETLEGATS